MEENFEYDLFISYSRSDYFDKNENKRQDSPVARILEILDANSISYWIDVEGECVGDNDFINKIVDKINNSKAVLFISSKDSNQSEWVLKEIIHADSRKKMIIPILIDESPIKETIKFLLGTTDEIYYFKNEKRAIEKLVKLVRNTKGVNGEIVKPAIKLRNVLAVACVALAIFAGAFLICFSLGFAFGYFGTRQKMEEVVDNAFRKNQLTIVNDHIVRFQSDRISVYYDIKNDTCIMDEKHTNSIFQNATMKDVMMAVSFTTFMQTVIKNANRTGNAKTRIIYIAAGCVGFFCGYSLGKYVGVNYALLKNDKELHVYFKRLSTRQMLKQRIDDYYQLQ